MTAGPQPEPSTLWFFDTVSLLTMTLDSGFTDVVDREVARTNGKRILTDVVLSELEYRATQDDTKEMAGAALVATDTAAWTEMKTTSVDPEKVWEVQLDVADGRTLPPGSKKHWAESVMIAMCRRVDARGLTQPFVFLSDDFDARRVANWLDHVRPVHLVGLVYAQYLRHEVPRDELLRLADIAHKADRCLEIIADDLRKGWPGFGRVGKPPFV